MLTQKEERNTYNVPGYGSARNRQGTARNNTVVLKYNNCVHHGQDTVKERTHERKSKETICLT